MQKITADEIKVFSKFIYDKSGILLDKSKGYLIETRLRPLMHEAKCQTFSEFYYIIKSDSSGKLEHQIVDAISTNETFFFRDTTPFDLLRNKILPELIDRRRQQYKATRIPLRIWSAACSTGQEVYSIAMTLKEMLPNLSAYNVDIIGSDISDKVVAQASYAKYSRFEVERGLPKQYLHRYFNQVGNEWRVKDEIRVMAQFNKTNLLKPFHAMGKFDVIFCRNVAIYFSQADKQKLFNNFATVLKSDGALLLGGSESLSGLDLPFESKSYLRGIYYQKKGFENIALKVPDLQRPQAKGASRTISPVQRVKPKMGRQPRDKSIEKQPLLRRSGPISKQPETSLNTGTVADASGSDSLLAKDQPPTRMIESVDILISEPVIKKSLLSSLQEKQSAITSGSLLQQRAKSSTPDDKAAKGLLLENIARREREKRQKLTKMAKKGKE